MCNNNDSSCIAEILKVICVLQQNAECGEACLDTCDRGFLGCGTNSLGCNTRPVMLYTCCGNGVPWKMPTTKDYNATCDGSDNTSCVFRVEKINGNCATFRVLTPNTEPEATYPFVATNCFFTMNLSCCCSIRCLNDTYIECI